MGGTDRERERERERERDVVERALKAITCRDRDALKEPSASVHCGSLGTAALQLLPVSTLVCFLSQRYGSRLSGTWDTQAYCHFSPAV